MGRFKNVNRGEVKEGSYVLYWMSGAARTSYNHALEYGVHMSNKLKKPLVVFMAGRTGYLYKRQEDFLISGMKDVKEGLETRGIHFIPGDCEALEAMKLLALKASMVIGDKPYIREDIKIRDKVLQALSQIMIEVDNNLLIPADDVSGKEEYAAATIRKKIWQQMAGENLEFMSEEYKKIPLEEELPAIPVIDLENIGNDSELIGGEKAAEIRLDDFIENKLINYDRRNHPEEDWSSGLSPYLRFGQISPLMIYQRIGESGFDGSGFLEELVVRRELAYNFVNYNENYDSYQGLPEWARNTLLKHSEDIRDYIYAKEQLEGAMTHDPCWNAAQNQLKRSGVMHNYMRMYWGKKIIEWSKSPEEAFLTALYLNNKYALDGFDPNSYTGVAWCFGKHDRPWTERKIFGMIRYMNALGLYRKFKMEPYIKRWT